MTTTTAKKKMTNRILWRRWMDFGIDALQCQMCGMATNIEDAPFVHGPKDSVSNWYFQVYYGSTI